MTDKQIIIDGVDVSGCDFYDKNKKYCLTLKMDTTGFKNPSCFSGDFQECIQDSKVCPYTFCDNNHNCYYKQLKRKEQECKALREEKAYTDMACEQFEQQLDQLKAENEELKEKVASYVCSTNCYKYKEAEAYNQALEKIKEIANRTCSTVKVEVCDSYDSCADCGATSQYRKLMQILQICDEVNE